MAKVLIVAGLVLLALGLLAAALPSGLPLGKLPGDIRIEREGTTVFIPITTCLVLSVGLSLVMWVISKLQ